MAVTLHRKTDSPNQSNPPKKLSLDNTLLYLVGAIGLIGSIYLVTSTTRTTGYSNHGRTQSGMIVSQKQLVQPVNNEEITTPTSTTDTVK